MALVLYDFPRDSRALYEYLWIESLSGVSVPQKTETHVCKSLEHIFYEILH